MFRAACRRLQIRQSMAGPVRDNAVKAWRSTLTFELRKSPRFEGIGGFTLSPQGRAALEELLPLRLPRHPAAA